MKTIWHEGKINFKKLKIGEVFAYEGCWLICEKISEKSLLVVAEQYDPGRMDGENSHNDCVGSIYTLGIYEYSGRDHFGLSSGTGFRSVFFNYSCDHSRYCYKLSTKVQTLWRQMK